MGAGAGLWGEHRGPEASPARRKAFWSGLRPSLAACGPPPIWGPWPPAPHAARGVLTVLRTAALPLAAPPLTAPPNYGKLIVGRRGGHHCPHYREKSSEPRERNAALFFALLPGSYVQEGAPCAGGAPRPRNPLPPSLFGGWARKVKKLFPVGRGYITGATAPSPCRGLCPCDPIFDKQEVYRQTESCGSFIAATAFIFTLSATEVYRGPHRISGNALLHVHAGILSHCLRPDRRRL